jgi:hypothetical protein
MCKGSRAIADIGEDRIPKFFRPVLPSAIIIHISAATRKYPLAMELGVPVFVGM